MKKLEATLYRRTHFRRRFLVQVLFSGNAAGTDLSPVLRRVGAAGEHLIDQGGHLANLGVAEMARQERRKVVDHTSFLHIADRLGRRADEHPAVLVLAVLL